jgi:isopentenyl phosphate kinase
MFSVTNTGHELAPVVHGDVRPTASGVMVLRRDQVLMTFLDLSLPLASQRPSGMR